jgi:hypothetical protein
MEQKTIETEQEDYHLVIKYKNGLYFKFYPEVFGNTSLYSKLKVTKRDTFVPSFSYELLETRSLYTSSSGFLLSKEVEK